jgi:hypothetical protein
MKYKRITDYQKNLTNPFLEKALEDIKIIKKTEVIRSKDRNDIQLITDAKTGEVNGHSAFMRFIEVEEEKFAKVYLSQFAAFWELGKPAIRVFGYILSVLKPNQDSFIFELDACLEHSQYKHKSMVFTGLANLLECSIIARTKYDHKYFINPLIVFNGNRVTFAKTYIKKQRSGPIRATDPAQIGIFENEKAS